MCLVREEACTRGRDGVKTTLHRALKNAPRTKAGAGCWCWDQGMALAPASAPVATPGSLFQSQALSLPTHTVAGGCDTQVVTARKGLRHTRACKCMFWGGFSTPQDDFQLETRACACPQGRQRQQRHPLVPLPTRRARQSVGVTAPRDTGAISSPHIQGQRSPPLLKPSG